MVVISVAANAWLTPCQRYGVNRLAASVADAHALTDAMVTTTTTEVIAARLCIPPAGRILAPISIVVAVPIGR
jgi:hypothetical protein